MVGNLSFLTYRFSFLI